MFLLPLWRNKDY